MSITPPGRQREADHIEVCGQRPGDRRVRLQRPQRSVSRRVRAMMRKVIPLR